jgi:D-inositol-3-phosphate glycosyltransferase
VAGEPKKESTGYVDAALRQMESLEPGRVTQRIEFIPDEETELYFKAADLLVLPYTHVYQSGVLFLAYSFGLPVVASDVGSFREDIIEGITGFVCLPCDSEDLRAKIETYFQSDLFQSLADRRPEIRRYGTAKHSWEIVGDKTYQVYAGLLGQERR